MAKEVKLKRGRLSEEEESYVEKWKDRMTAEAMAAKLRRPVSTIEKHLEKLDPLKPHAKRDMKMADELETRPEWANFREQFTDPELRHFKYRYVQLMSQFSDQGIMPTEEMQLFQVITLDILIQRTMKEQKEVTQEMTRAHEDIERMSEDFKDMGDKETLDTLKAAEGRYAKGADQLKNLSQRYESYLMRQSAMLKELKGTRDQRVKIFENSKQSFLGYLRLLNEEDMRLSIGREAGLMKAATEAELVRMAQPHVFHDKQVDQILLTPETVLEHYDAADADAD